MRTCLNTLAHPSVMCRMPQGLGCAGLPSVHRPELTLLSLESPPEGRLAQPHLLDRQNDSGECLFWAPLGGRVGPGWKDTAVVGAPGSHPGLLDGAPFSGDSLGWQPPVDMGCFLL